MISVIVPIYNSQKVLDKCICSILGQTYKDLEIILIDDASTDKSRAICETYVKENNNISLIEIEKNLGQVSAYIKGIEASRGELIGFVDSDDWIEPEMYSELLASMNNSFSDIASCGIFMDFQDKTIIEPKGIQKYDGLVMDHDEIAQEFYELHKPDNKISNIFKLYRWTRLYRREIVFNCLKYLQTNIRVFEDNNFVIPCFLDATKISYVGKPLYHYVRREGSTMGTFNKSIIASNHFFLENQKKIYKEKNIEHIMDSDAYVTTAFSLNGILLSNDSINEKYKQIIELRNDIIEYNLTRKKCIKYGASNKLSIMIELIKRNKIIIVLLLGQIYKVSKNKKNESFHK